MVDECICCLKLSFTTLKLQKNTIFYFYQKSTCKRILPYKTVT